MRLFALAALVAVCGAAKLDRGYLPPASSQTAGGLPRDLQTPFARSSQNNQGLGGIPTGAYNNDFGGVVVDASAAGTRAAGPGESGLGGSRDSYGSQVSKVGDAAFRQTQTAGFRTPDFDFQGEADAETVQGFEPQQSHPERQQAAQDRAANTLRFDSEVGPESFNYAFETDNGISAEENGVATNGVQAQGAFSYTADDGQTYSVTYTADEKGYQPKGDHLPTPPPIPEEILKSLEKNAQDEAAGLIDDGSYDASKYNAGSDYNESDNNGQYNGGQSSVGSGNGATSDIGAGSSFVSQNTFAQQNADAGNNGEGNFEQSASNNAPGHFAQLSQSGSQHNFGHATGQVDFGNQQFGAKNNFEYLPPNSQVSQASSQASFSGFRSQQLNQPSRNIQQTGFSNSRPSQSASASASFGSGQVNEPQPTAAPAQYNSASVQSVQGLQGHNEQQFQRNNGFMNQRPSQSASSSATFGSVQVNQPQHTGAPSLAHSSTVNQQGFQSQSQSQQPNYPSENSIAQPSAQYSQMQIARLTQQTFRQPQPQYNANKNVQGFAPGPTPSAFASASVNTKTNQLSQKNPQTLSSSAPQGQIQQNGQFNQFKSSQVQTSQSQFNQPLFASSTQKPSFAFQNTQDDSYYYNQPAQPFRTPTVEPQINVNQQSNQFDKLAQSSFSANANAQFSAFPTQPSFAQRGSTRYPRPPTLSPAAPTVSIQPDTTSFDHFNGVTQATASSFSAASNVNQQGSQTFSRPNQPMFPSQRPTQQSFSQPQEEVKPSQQYDGELYQYPKPADTPTQQKDSSSQSTELVDSEVLPTQNTQAFASAEYQGSSVAPAFNQAEFHGSVASGLNQASAEFGHESGAAPIGSQISAASVAGKGEVFGGPRQPPSFDENGYHY